MHLVSIFITRILCGKSHILSNKRNAWLIFFLFYVKFKYQKYILVFIFGHCNVQLLLLVSLFKILTFRLLLWLHQKCTPLNKKVTRFVRTLCQRIKTVILVCIMKIQILLLLLASDMSFDTKCDRKICIVIGNSLLFVLSRITWITSFVLKKVWNQLILKCSLMNSQSKFVIGLFMLDTVPTYQTPEIHYCQTNETTSTFLTSGFHMKSEYLTPLCKLRVDDFKGHGTALMEM